MCWRTNITDLTLPRLTFHIFSYKNKDMISAETLLFNLFDISCSALILRIKTRLSLWFIVLNLGLFSTSGADARHALQLSFSALPTLTRARQVSGAFRRLLLHTSSAAIAKPDNRLKYYLLQGICILIGNKYITSSMTELWQNSRWWGSGHAIPEQSILAYWIF